MQANFKEINSLLPSTPNATEYIEGNQIGFKDSHLKQGKKQPNIWKYKNLAFISVLFCFVFSQLSHCKTDKTEIFLRSCKIHRSVFTAAFGAVNVLTARGTPPLGWKSLPYIQILSL